MADAGKLISFDDMPPKEGEMVERTRQLEPRKGPEPYATGPSDQKYSQELYKPKALGALGMRGHGDSD